jgi:hypothetical protein
MPEQQRTLLKEMQEEFKVRPASSGLMIRSRLLSPGPQLTPKVQPEKAELLSPTTEEEDDELAE